MHVVAGMVDMKKDCVRPGCPDDHRSQCSPVATRIEMTSANGTFLT